ncbi:hypothetical protein PF003_g16780 [Phytophthora fragariae]|nr:hypothetical protein PF003_g16780 [Phytophthora fragariae]
MKTSVFLHSPLFNTLTGVLAQMAWIIDGRVSNDTTRTRCCCVLSLSCCLFIRTWKRSGQGLNRTMLFAHKSFSTVSLAH